ncbi:hypothetical protein SRHO_G00245410 [Serrasalmus rhombeus]
MRTKVCPLTFSYTNVFSTLYENAVGLKVPVRWPVIAVFGCSLKTLSSLCSEQTSGFCTEEFPEEKRDGNLSDWVGRERFRCYFQMDSFTLYQMGETTKLVALAIVDETNPTTESVRYKALMEKVATEYRDHYNTNFQFGYIQGNDYINGFIMGELALPSLIVMNMTIDGYYLPEQKIETMEELLQFLNSVLNGRSKLLGGNGYVRRMKRLYYRVTSAVKTGFASAPFVTCFLLSLPVGLVVMIVWGVCTAVPVDEDKADEGALLATGTRPAASQRKRTEKPSNESKKED